MDFESIIGKQVLSKHRQLLQEQAEQQKEKRADRIKAHRAALQAEPFFLAARLMTLCAIDQTVEKAPNGYKKIFTPLEYDEDRRLRPSLGITARLGWLGRRVVSDDIRLSLVLRESELEKNPGATEQPLAILYRRNTTGSQRPFGVAKYDPLIGHYADTSSFESQEVALLVREAAVCANISVLPLELPPEDQTAV